MSKHKTIPKTVRMKLYEKYNGHCGYCGCNLKYEDMQIDHIKSIYRNLDYNKNLSENELYNENNLIPACRQCNFYKSTFTVEQFRERIKTVLFENLKKNFNYKMALKYGLINECNDKNIIFYYETLKH